MSSSYNLLFIETISLPKMIGEELTMMKKFKSSKLPSTKLISKAPPGVKTPDLQRANSRRRISKIAEKANPLSRVREESIEESLEGVPEHKGKLLY